MKATTTYIVQGWYEGEWEDLTAEDTFSEARARVREYQVNEGGSYRIRRRIERVEESE